jgi:hypothetical protein
MKTTKEAVNYCKNETRAIRIARSYYSEKVFVLSLYCDTEMRLGDYVDSIYVSKRTLKGYLRHFTSKNNNELNEMLSNNKRDDIEFNFDSKILI